VIFEVNTCMHSELVDQLSKLTVMEVVELVKALEEKWGVSAAVPAAASAPTAAAAAEKSSFDVILMSAGEAKINVIKVVKEITGLGLAESKAIVDGAPKTVKAGVQKAEAEDIKKKLSDAGATVELK
jgi:large subunit ribosomal protein L7/L12